MELVLIRIQRSKQQWLGWSTALTASSFAAVGARQGRVRRYCARQGEQVAALGSWEHAESATVLGRELWLLLVRRQ